MRASHRGGRDDYLGFLGQVSASRVAAHCSRSRVRRTAKVWKDFQLLYDLVGHQQSVWTVLAIDGSQFLTGPFPFTFPRARAF